MNLMKTLISILIFWSESMIVDAKEQLHEALTDLDPYGTVILTNDLRKIDPDQRTFLRNIMTVNPRVLIDLNRTFKSTKRS